MDVRAERMPQTRVLPDRRLARPLPPPVIDKYQQQQHKHKHRDTNITEPQDHRSNARTRVSLCEGGLSPLPGAARNGRPRLVRQSRPQEHVLRQIAVEGLDACIACRAGLAPFLVWGRRPADLGCGSAHSGFPQSRCEVRAISAES